ncbi:peroxisome assembly protein 12 [Onthophagus taurus]|uniref:peroxisome assembly protein 12 n=1 Tax=Onthophagus taurus TaxID=166361 RepID=UPI0039BE1DCA
MAEKAANFAFTSEAKPSIFEVIAQHSLNITLHPALKRIAEFLAESSPKHFNWLYTHYEETFLVLNGLLQYYYIKKYDASFSEYFYGLKRISSDGKLLSDHQRKLSFLFLVILPYLKRKLEERINFYKIQNAEGVLTSKTKKLLIYSHSTFDLTWGVWVLINYLRYMSDKTIYQRPTLQLIQIQLILVEDRDDVSSFWGALFKGKLKLKEFTSGVLKHGLRTCLEIGAFFIQFLQTWYAEKSDFNVTALPTVPPPNIDSKAKALKGKCPICLQPWKIPTVLPASGYVYCFPCIVKHFRENASTCPVSNIPVRALDLVRLYDS